MHICVALYNRRNLKYDANVVDKVKGFVHLMRDEASKYICSDRLELKAQLGVTWAIQFPEKIFKLINEQIKSVPHPLPNNGYDASSGAAEEYELK